MTGADLNRLVEMLASETKTHVMARIAAAVEPLEARIRELEQRPAGVEFAGPFQQGKSYRPGQLVQRRGLWLCTDDTSLAPGSAPAAWRLIVRATE